MRIQTEIDKRGFSKWYERELMRGHVQLVLLLLCTLATLGSLEALSVSGSQRLLMVLTLIVSAAVGVWSLRRYLFHLSRAEFIANQATCPFCATYGRFRVNAVQDAEVAGVPPAMQVCCRRCSGQWRIQS
jgi:hypothetical protein